MTSRANRLANTREIFAARKELPGGYVTTFSARVLMPHREEVDLCPYLFDPQGRVLGVRDDYGYGHEEDTPPREWADLYWAEFAEMAADDAVRRGNTVPGEVFEAIRAMGD